MNELGTRYSISIRSPKEMAVEIEQQTDGLFGLIVGGEAKKRFHSADAARQHLISLLSDELGIQNARATVPALIRWKIDTIDLFDPEVDG